MTPEERAHCAWIAYEDTELSEANGLEKAFKAVVAAAIREAEAEEREGCAATLRSEFPSMLTHSQDELLYYAEKAIRQRGERSA